MHRLGVVVLATLLPIGVAAGAAVAVAGDDPPSDEQCRQQWADLGQLHGENGNPRGPVPALRQRWNDLDQEADRYAAEATAADCGASIDDFAALWDALESFQYDLDAFDPADDLQRAEQDRHHYLSMHGQLRPEVKRAFRVIRQHTPGATRDLEPALAGAEDVDVRDDMEVRAFLRHGREIKRASHHIHRMRHPYRVIGDAELNEE